VVVVVDVVTGVGCVTVVRSLVSVVVVLAAGSELPQPASKPVPESRDTTVKIRK
jgi:hypothetical protein